MPYGDHHGFQTSIDDTGFRRAKEGPSFPSKKRPRASRLLGVPSGFSEISTTSDKMRFKAFPRSILITSDGWFGARVACSRRIPPSRLSYLGWRSVLGTRSIGTSLERRISFDIKAFGSSIKRSVLPPEDRRLQGSDHHQTTKYDHNLSRETVQVQSHYSSPSCILLPFPWS